MVMDMVNENSTHFSFVCCFSFSNCVKQRTITSKSIHVRYSLQEMENLLKHEAAGLLLQEEGIQGLPYIELQ